MLTKRRASLAVCALLTIALAAPAALAGPHGHGHGQGNGQGEGQGEGGGGGGDEDNGGIRHVLLLSIDGMHAVDYLNCVKAGTCPTLKALGQSGVNYLATSTSKPSDSFPGLTAIISGGSPRTEGAFYDVAYDRSLQPPKATTGNSLIGAPGLCTPGQVPTGTRTEYEEGIDIDQSHLTGGAPSGDGGVNSINPDFLIRDPANNCNPVFPWNFVRTNTVFGVIHSAKGYTAWSDKHPAYASVSGPGATAGNIDDFYGPEINSDPANFETDPHPPVPPSLATCSPHLPGSFAAGDDYTKDFQNIQCYDGIKVQAILNEIDGKTHNASGPAPVPNILGMNFQAVSVGQKLVQATVPPAPYSQIGGYMDGMGTPSPSLAQEIAFVDKSIGLMVSELSTKGLLDKTLIIVTAKHGQSPIDPLRLLRIHGDVPTDKSPSTILGLAFLPDSEINQIGPTEDDISLLWLKPGASTDAAVALLQMDSPVIPQSANIAGISQIFYDASILPMFNSPSVDPRTPDVIVQPNVGVVYTNHQAKVAEHGGFANDDTNVIMLLSNPKFKAKTVFSPVETTQVAPTILEALGLNPHELQAVQIEGTQVLPAVQFSSGD